MKTMNYQLRIHESKLELALQEPITNVMYVINKLEEQEMQGTPWKHFK